jgi:hypothetical protein
MEEKDDSDLGKKRIRKYVETPSEALKRIRGRKKFPYDAQTLCGIAWRRKGQSHLKG